MMKIEFIPYLDETQYLASWFRPVDNIDVKVGYKNDLIE